MCFCNNYDWRANVNETTFAQSDKPSRCYECGRDILAGEWRQEVFQQEHEQCQICEDSFSDLFIDLDLDDDEEWRQKLMAELAEHKHDYGETFSCTICRECCLLLESIYDREAKEGCPEHSRQPMFGELSDAVSYGGYGEHAVAMFPELARHKFLANTEDGR